MAAAIPAAIGIGSSLIGGISGKGAKKKQEKLAAQQLAQLQPVIQSFLRMAQQSEGLFPEAANMLRESYGKAGTIGDTAFTDYKRLLDDALNRSGELTTTGKGYIQGAATGLDDLRKFYRPFMEGRNAIDSFLPSKSRTESLLAPEFASINEGFQGTMKGLENAPRGGGRISAFNEANMRRQSDLSKTFFQGRQALGDKALAAAFQGASGESNRLGQLGQLGIGTVGAGTSLLSTEGGLAQGALGQSLQALLQQIQAGGGMGALSQSGMSNAGRLFDLYNSQANRTYGAVPSSGTPGKGLGGFLVDLFQSSPMQGALGNIFKGSKGGGITGAGDIWPEN